jgi:KDO2-lipid IV(A) lauroyltransferase
VFVPFFGVQAATLLAPARIAGGYGAQVVPAITRRDPRTGRYCLRLEPAWQDYPGPDLTEATRRLNQALEQWVLQMPAQYLWVHQRFKTRPAGQPPFYA